MNGKKILSLVLAIAMIASTGIALISGLRGSSQATEVFDYSESFDNKGYFKGVKAKDYVNLPDYKSFKFTDNILSVTDELMDSQLKAILANYRTEEADEDADRVTAMGDSINLDYVGSVNGVEFANGSTKGEGTKITIGSAGYLIATEECQGFEEQLVGHKAGENFDITVQFPEGYSPSTDADGNEVILSGRVAVFNITINTIYKTVTPELTDEFVTKYFGDKLSTVEELKAELESELIDSQKNGYLWSVLRDSLDVSDHPAKVMDFEKGLEIANLKMQANYYGMDLATMLGYYGLESEDAYLEEIEDSIKENVETDLLIQAICEAEGLEATKDDIKAFFADRYGSEDYSQYEAMYGTNYLRHVVLENKMVDVLTEMMMPAAE